MLTHLYQMGESIVILGASGVIFKIFIPLFDEIPLSKWMSPKWDAASGAMLFAYAAQIVEMEMT